MQIVDEVDRRRGRWSGASPCSVGGETVPGIHWLPAGADRTAHPRCASATAASSTSASTTCSPWPVQLVTNLGVGVVSLDAPEHGDRLTDPDAAAGRCERAAPAATATPSRSRFGRKARAAMAERAKVHVAEWRALLDDLQTDPRWADGPVRLVGRLDGHHPRAPARRQRRAHRAPPCSASTPSSPATSGGRRGAARSRSRCCSSASPRTS